MTSVNDDRYAIYPEIKGDAKVVEIEVPMRPFSFVVEKYKMDKVDLIKVDVKGNELIVLQSMELYLKRDKLSILIEISGDNDAVITDGFFRPISYESLLNINENGKTFLVDNLWNNEHHNFLICNGDIIQKLRKKNLVQ